jgi:pimeloyl-ACP methyl ester carboxylesterase
MDSGSFTSLLEKDTWRGVAADFTADSDRLLIVFGGIKGQLEMPVFEFARSTADLRVNKILLRDHEQAWYHRGVVDVAGSVDGVVAYLRGQIERHGCRRVVTLGNSMGGYAAILVGCLLPAAEAIAFSPQTFIGRFRRLINRDHRWWRQFGRMYRSASAKPLYYDLKTVLLSQPGPTRYDVYYGRSSRADRRHALRLAAVPGVALHAVNVPGHNVVRALRDTGELRETLRRTLEVVT